MAFDPCNPATIYLTVSSFNVPNGGFYRSVDAGASWTRLGNLDEPLRVRVDPRDSKHLYVGDGVRGATLGFYVSHDGGLTVTKPPSLAKLNLFVDDVYDIAADPADFNHVLVTSHSPWNSAGAGVLESSDGGTTWIVHNPLPSWGQGHNIWFVKNSSTWLLGTQGAGYWRTTDAGQNWKQVTTENMTHGGGQLYITKAGTLFVSCASGVLKSVDDGATWQTITGVKFTTSIYGDGNLLYGHQAYAGPTEAFSTSPETDGVTWTPFKGGAQTFADGPFEMAFDSTHHIMYAANWGVGLWALKVQ
jgi:photosystem II stability/assembly factor-like uncharacterized protein